MKNLFITLILTQLIITGCTINIENPNQTNTTNDTSTTQKETSTSNTSEPTKNTPETNQKNITINEKEKHYEIKANYPNTKNAKLNKAFKELVDNSISDFKNNIFDPEAEGFEDFPLQTLTISTTETQNKEITSYKVLIDSYTGGAHPNAYYTTVNFNFKDNEFLELKDIFIKDSMWLDGLSYISTEKVVAKLGDNADLDWVNTGIGLDPANLNVWELNQKNLIITFNPYQVAPYAAGVITIEIPFTELKEYIRPELVEYLK